MFARIVSLLRWEPLEPGTSATPLSLTADEGTWIKLPDFVGHLNVALVFFRAGDCPDTRKNLSSIQAVLPQLQEREVAVFGVNTARPEALRALRAELGLDFFLLYDPFGMAARGFHASGRVTPRCRNQVVLIGKDGKVAHSRPGRVDGAELLTLVDQVIRGAR